MAEPIRVEEAYNERDETINAQGAVTEIEIPYLVFGVADESAAAERRAKLHVLHVLHGQKRNLKQPHLVPQRNITARAVISRFGLSFFSAKSRAGELTNHRRMCYHTAHLLWDTNDVER